MYNLYSTLTFLIWTFHC